MRGTYEPQPKPSEQAEDNEEPEVERDGPWRIRVWLSFTDGGTAGIHIGTFWLVLGVVGVGDLVVDAMTFRLFDGNHGGTFENADEAWREAWNWWVDGGYTEEGPSDPPPMPRDFTEANRMLRKHHVDQGSRTATFQEGFPEVTIDGA